MTNRNRASVPREHVVLYQFSARGHDVAQTILGSMLDHPHDGQRLEITDQPIRLVAANLFQLEVDGREPVASLGDVDVGNVRLVL